MFTYGGNGIAHKPEDPNQPKTNHLAVKRCKAPSCAAFESVALADVQQDSQRYPKHGEDGSKDEFDYDWVIIAIDVVGVVYPVRRKAKFDQRDDPLNLNLSSKSCKII